MAPQPDRRPEVPPAHPPTVGTARRHLWPLNGEDWPAGRAVWEFPRMNRLLFLTSLIVAGTPMTASAQMPPSPEPGPEHRFIHSLAGGWSVWVDGVESGTAVGRLRMNDLFVELELKVSSGPIEQAIYIVGYDDRNDDFIITALDNTGTYSVSASGRRIERRIALYGVDDDPTFRQMGITKEFAYVLELADTEASIEILFIDTRTDEREEIPFLRFELRRSG